jgi:uncharacterized protein YaaN involved in tellurite resistance
MDGSLLMASPASSPVDMKSMMAQQMVKRLAAHGPQGSDPNQSGRQLSEQMSQLSGADPQMLSKAAEQVKSMLVAIYTKTAFQVPEAARHAATAQKAVDQMLKALEQGAATAQTVQPIVNQAGMSGADPNAGGTQGAIPQSGGM